MNMITAILSILVFALLVRVFNKIFTLKVCPICAGVTLTWLWMLFGMWFGFLSVPGYELITAILMGASIGGIVTELKKLFPKFRRNNSARDKKIESLENKLKNCC